MLVGSNVKEDQKDIMKQPVSEISEGLQVVTIEQEETGRDIGHQDER